MPSNQQFVNTNAATCVNPQPVNMADCLAFSSADATALPNANPAYYYIVFKMVNGVDVKWSYTSSTDRNADFTAVVTAVGTTV